MKKSNKYLMYRVSSLFLISRLLRFIKTQFLSFGFNALFDPPIAIEEGFYHAIQSLHLNIKELEYLGVIGVCAANGEFITE